MYDLSRCDLISRWNESQSILPDYIVRTVVIWCFIEMRNNGAPQQPHRRPVVIWCFIEMRNNNMCVKWLATELWFDALLKCETIATAEPKRLVLLWFDALLKCETIVLKQFESGESCDLMLYWNVKQYQRKIKIRKIGCDLMLYWNVKQYGTTNAGHNAVVIWCSIEMWNNGRHLSLRKLPLWFDALLKCETIRGSSTPGPFCCDLMLYWNVKQYILELPNDRMVVIWCSIEMWNNNTAGQNTAAFVVIWCSIEMWNNNR